MYSFKGPFMQILNPKSFKNIVLKISIFFLKGLKTSFELHDFFPGVRIKNTPLTISNSKKSF